MPATAIGLRTQLYGPAITRWFAIAKGRGVPCPRVDITDAAQRPSALAAARRAIPTGSATHGNVASTAHRSSKSFTRNGIAIRNAPQNTTICTSVAVTCAAGVVRIVALRNARGPRMSHSLGMRPSSTMLSARTEPAADAAIISTPQPASVVMVAYTASAAATRLVHPVATIAAVFEPHAAAADAMTKSGMSSTATATGSRLPSVVSRTHGDAATAIHHAAPAANCTA